MVEFQEVLTYWFDELGATGWYKKSKKIDDNIRQRFGNTLKQAVKGELAIWRETAKGTLAEIIVLDQFSRNIFRDTPKAFSQDPQALTLAQVAIKKGFDKQLPEQQKVFMYMPFMHSESRLIHEHALQLFKGLSNENYELAHKKIIDQFGRYPHRNEILNRVSSPAEIEFLKQPGSRF